MNLPSRFTSSARRARRSSFKAWQLARARLHTGGHAFFGGGSTPSLRRGLATLFVLLFGFGLCAGARAVPTFSLSASTLTASAGSTFTLDLMANDVDREGIGGWSFGLTVADGSVASLIGIDFSGALGAIGSQALAFGDTLLGMGGVAPASGAQRVEFGVTSLLASPELAALQGGSFRLATLSFAALAAGTTEVSLVLPAIGAALSDAAGNAVAIGLPTGAGASISVFLPAVVSPVPEPATQALLLSGLACLVVVGRGRRKR